MGTESRYPQVRQLESLRQQLPSLDAPVRRTSERRNPRRAKRLNEAQVQQLAAGYEAGATVYELGKQFGISRQTVGKLLKQHGVTMRRQGLSPERVHEASLLYESDRSLVRMSERRGVDAETVRQRLKERGVRCGIRMNGNGRAHGAGWRLLALHSSRLRRPDLRDAQGADGPVGN